MEDSDMNLAPIALFVYNRPSHTHQTVTALKANILAASSDLIIFSDAPKTADLSDAVSEVRQYLRQIDGFKSVTIIERVSNFGLATSIIEGVTSVINEHGRIIVLEDDLLVATDFLDYMNFALKKYEAEHRVVQVSGYMFPINIEIDSDALLLPLTTSWGWATWKRAWQLFDADATGYAVLQADTALRLKFNLNGAYDFYSVLEAQLAGKIDSWAIRWWLSTFLQEALTVYPRRSLIVNIGLDGSGTHGANSGLPKGAWSEKSAFIWSFPAEIQISEAWEDVCTALKRNEPFSSAIKRRILSFFRLKKS